jgi:hypothetical protein
MACKKYFGFVEGETEFGLVNMHMIPLISTRISERK